MHTRLAAIDLGSNSFRLEIGRVKNDEIVCEHYCKEGVRLAAGLDEHGALTEESQQKALETLERFHQKIKNFSPEHVRAVGTQTTKSFCFGLKKSWAFRLKFCPDRKKHDWFLRVVLTGFPCLIKNGWSSTLAAAPRN